MTTVEQLKAQRSIALTYQFMSIQIQRPPAPPPCPDAAAKPQPEREGGNISEADFRNEGVGA